MARAREPRGRRLTTDRRLDDAPLRAQLPGRAASAGRGTSDSRPSSSRSHETSCSSPDRRSGSRPTSSLRRGEDLWTSPPRWPPRCARPTALGAPPPVQWCAYAEAVLFNALGRFGEALGRGAANCFVRTTWPPRPWRRPSSLTPRRAPAPSRSSASCGAWVHERVTIAPTPWALGVLARIDALAADASTAEQHYVASLAHLEACSGRSELARTQLGVRRVAALPKVAATMRDASWGRLRPSPSPRWERWASPIVPRVSFAPLGTTPEAGRRGPTPRAHRAGSAGGVTGQSGPDQSRDRGPTLHQPPHGAVPPPKGLPEARHHLARPAAPR